jgi:hypothetical protein
MMDDPKLAGFWRGLGLARDGLTPIGPNPHRQRSPEHLDYATGYSAGTKLGRRQRQEAAEVAEILRESQVRTKYGVPDQNDGDPAV